MMLNWLELIRLIIRNLPFTAQNFIELRTFFPEQDKNVVSEITTPEQLEELLCFHSLVMGDSVYKYNSLFKNKIS